MFNEKKKCLTLVNNSTLCVYVYVCVCVCMCFSWLLDWFYDMSTLVGLLYAKIILTILVSERFSQFFRCLNTAHSTGITMI